MRIAEPHLWVRAKLSEVKEMDFQVVEHSRAKKIVRHIHEVLCLCTICGRFLTFFISAFRKKKVEAWI